MPPAADPEWREIVTFGRLAGKPVYYWPVTSSTNSEALRLAASGTAHGTLVVADRQEQGRGRRGRSWFSPAGAGLYCSFVLRPRLAVAELPRLTLAAGVAVCRALEERFGLGPALKWPNDILLAGAKCGGILVEGDGRAAVVVGIGLNLRGRREDFPEPLRQRAISVQEASGRIVPRGPLLRALAVALAREVACLESGGWPEILAAWRHRDGLRNKKLAWLTPAGSVVTGVSLGPDQEGRLRIRDDRGREHQVVSGDVSLAPQGESRGTLV